MNAGLSTDGAVVSQGRYQPIRKLGRGNFGDVHLAFDGLRGRFVAVKTMRDGGVDGLRELRREFRALRDINHPNLVELLEIHVDELRASLVMEYVDGTSIIEHVRSIAAVDRLDVTKRCLRQLVEAIDTLHAAGVLHRDIKPSNVMVERTGRVVLLDFGLVKHMDSQRSSNAYLCGTAAYMSPEQASGNRLGPSSDWYSLGVVIHEILVDRLPFDSSSLPALIHAKTSRPAPSIRSLMPHLGLYDADVIDRLLAPDPNQRPPVAELRRWLGDAGVPPSERAPARSNRHEFVGRRQELGELSLALKSSKRGARSMLLVSGPSGVGKSALVRTFLTRAMADDQVLVFVDRCHDREFVPFNGLEGVFESISTMLRGPLADAVLTAADKEVLAQLVEGATLDGPRFVGPRDAFLRRRVAGRAVARLLQRDAGERCVVFWIDDAHWLSPDAAQLLADLLAEPWPAGLLIIGSVRRDVGCAALTALSNNASPREIVLGPMNAADARDLTSALTNPSTISAEAIERLIRDADGHPIILSQAAGLLADGAEATTLRDLKSIVRARVDALEPSERALVTVACVAARPLPPAILSVAANVTNTERKARRLVQLSLLQWSGLTGELLSPYHDTIRSTVVDSLTDQNINDIRRAIARSMEAAQLGGPEDLVDYYLAAGEVSDAARHVAAAARHSEDMLAFDRAAAFYQLEIELAERLGTQPTARSREALATSLANAGRGESSARAYLDAARHLPTEHAAPLISRAADQLIRSGRVDEGLSVARVTLRTLGIRLSRTSLSALPSALWGRLWLWWRGLHYTLAPERAVPRMTLEKIDWCLGLGAVLPFIDTIRGLQIHGQGLRAALSSGEPTRLSRAFAAEASYRMALSGGEDPSVETSRLLETARILADASGDPVAHGVVDVVTSTLLWAIGDWQAVEDMASRGVQTLRLHGKSVAWETNLGQTNYINALGWMGRLREHRAVLERELQSARARGDLYASTMFTLRDLCLASVADDDIASARETALAIARWSSAGFHVEHMVVLYQQTEADLYERAGTQARDRVDGTWTALRRSQLLRVAPFRIELGALKARAYVAAAVDTASQRERTSLLRQAQRVASKIAAEAPSVRRDVLNAPIRAALALLLGRDTTTALADLSAGVESATAAKMGLHAAAMCYWRARVRGPAADDDADAATATLAALGVRRPDRYVHLHGPGMEAAIAMLS